LRHIENGKYFIWLVFISAWACDTGAYFIGINFGKHRLTPKLSPKKSVEGAVGGTLTAVAAGFLFGWALTYFIPEYKGLHLAIGGAIVCFAGSVFAQFGDLTASAIKRYKDIKDFGKILPGHGGVLDRFDSVIFTAPVVYLTILSLQGLY
jgi:phosphatidate cytidylyltransferase